MQNMHVLGYACWQVALLPSIHGQVRGPHMVKHKMCWAVEARYGLCCPLERAAAPPCSCPEADCRKLHTCVSACCSLRDPVLLSRCLLPAGARTACCRT